MIYDIQFDAESHIYHVNGERTPNVTTILKPLTDFGTIPADKLEIARQKGVAVHAMVEYAIKDELDEGSIPDWMLPIYERWLKFVRESGFEPICSERRVFHPLYKYVGTLDIFCTLFGEEAFIDVKRSFFAGAVIGYQLAAYQEAHAAQEGTGKRAKRYALKLNEAGPYRLEPFTDKLDFTHFLTCLNFRRLKEKHT